jgi:DNA-binding MarR family transcriptional regulator
MLNRAELRSWLEVIEGMRSLLNALDRDLRNRAGISHDDYEILSRLHRAANRSMRMSELALDVGCSPSRLTHAITRLEQDGLVLRSRSAADGRGVEAVLTETGVLRVREASAGHFDQVRRLVFDTLGPDRARELASAMGKIRRAASEQPSPARIAINADAHSRPQIPLSSSHSAGVSGSRLHPSGR